MLDIFRKKIAGILVKFLFAILIFSFGIWGIGDYISPSANNATLATVGSTEITTEEFNADFTREFRRIQQTLGGQITREQAHAFGMSGQVLNRKINTMLVNNGANDLGIIISDEQILGRIQSSESFRNAKGEFNRNVFDEVLRNNDMNEGMYVNMMRGDLSNLQFLGSIQSGVISPKSFAENIYRVTQEKRTARFIRIKDSAVAAPATPNASTLAKYHKDNAARFTAPEYRTVTVVALKAEDLSGEMTVNKDEISEAYDARAAEFNLPEQRKLQQFVVPKQADATRAHEMLKSGRSFADVAKEVAKVEAKALEIGLLSKDQLLGDMANAVFALKTGDYSAPVKTALGWHLIRVTDIKAARTQTLADVSDKLEKDIAREKAIDGLFSLTNKLEDALSGGASLEEAATGLNLKTRSIGPVDARGGTPGGLPGMGLAANPTFLGTVFKTPEGEESFLTEDGKSGYFIARVDQITSPALRPLDTVRGDVITAWKKGQQKTQAETSAKDVLKQLKGGTSLDTVAKKLKLKAEESKPFTRNPDGKLPAALVADLFKAASGDYAMARDATGYVVARLKKVIAANPASETALVKKISQQLSQSMRTDIAAQMADHLRSKYPVTTNQAALNQIFIQQ